MQTGKKTRYYLIHTSTNEGKDKIADLNIIHQPTHPSPINIKIRIKEIGILISLEPYMLSRIRFCEINERFLEVSVPVKSNIGLCNKRIESPARNIE